MTERERERERPKEVGEGGRKEGGERRARITATGGSASGAAVGCQHSSILSAAPAARA